MKHIKEVYFQILANNFQLKQILIIPENVNHAVGQNQKQVKLPNLELPIFEGKLEDWPLLKNCYLSLIHRNKGLSDMENFQYFLVSFLKSEP